MSPPLTTDGAVLADSPFLHSPATILPHKRTIVHLTRDLIQPLVVLPNIPPPPPDTSASAAITPVAGTDSNAEAPPPQPQPQPTSPPPNDDEAENNSNTAAEPPKKKKKKKKKKNRDEDSQGQPVYTTRFGNFPHASLLGLPAGSQVQSSTGQGFIHILNPTPELWTASLPHRTQVVYTPDSSYILHRLRVRPGSRVVEAGAGSGSFTHAAARAAYDGLGGTGRVFSFEFHDDRVGVLRKEVERHGLNGLVNIVGRDVCANGFDTITDEDDDLEGKEHIDANAVFLDLPAPWLAVPNLTRREGNKRAPLSPYKPVHICVFSPCLEQSLRTIKVLRDLAWAEIDLVEIAHRRLEVRRIGPGGREITGKPSRHIQEDESSNSPSSLSEAVSNMKEVLEYRKRAQAAQAAKARNETTEEDFFGEYARSNNITSTTDNNNTKEEDIEEARKRMLHAGRVITRPEPDLKTHTSYLVFAVLPVVWTPADEAAAMEKYPLHKVEPEVNLKKGEPVEGSKRSLKKELKRKRAEEAEAAKEKQQEQQQEQKQEEGGEDSMVEMVDADEAG